MTEPVSLCRVGTGEGVRDLPCTDGLTNWTLSLLPVAQNAAQAALNQPLGLFLPRALALVVLRRAEVLFGPPPQGEAW